MRSERMMLETEYIIVLRKVVKANHKQRANIKQQFLKSFGAIMSCVLSVFYVSIILN